MEQPPVLSNHLLSEQIPSRDPPIALYKRLLQRSAQHHRLDGLVVEGLVL